MAEFLIYAKNNNSKDIAAYKKGDIVVVMPDDHVWGKEELSPKFSILKVPDLKVSAASKYTAEHKNKGKMVRRRKYQLVDSFQGGEKIAIKKAEIKNHIKIKAV